MGICFSSNGGKDVISPKRMVTDDLDDDLVLTQHDHRSPATPVGMKRVKTPEGDISDVLNESMGSAETLKLNLERSAHGVTNHPTPVGMKRVLTNESLTGSSTNFDIYSIESQGSVLDTSMAIQTHEANIPLLFAGKTKKGISPNQPTKPNQDSFLMQHHQKSQSMIVAVFDGHGQFGHHVSLYCKEYIASKLPQHSAFVTDLRKAINDVILEVEKVMLQESDVDTVFSGTTMTLMIVRENKVTIANIGDSRAVLGMELICPKSESETKEIEPYAMKKVIPLSIDHKPEMPDEASRITNHGGRVTVVNGCGRVYLATADVPGLAMSRSLGDFVAHKAGVSSIPDIFEYTMKDLYSRFDDIQDHIDGGKLRLSFMVATDGVFDMMSNEHAVDISLKNWEQPGQTVNSIMEITDVAWKNKWNLCDDTTLCVVNFEHILPKNNMKHITSHDNIVVKLMESKKEKIMDVPDALMEVDDIDNDHDDHDVNVLVNIEETEIDFTVIHHDNISADLIVDKKQIDTQI